MDPIFARAFFAAVGASGSFLLGLRRGRFRKDKLFRKAVIEVAGGTLAGALAAIPVLPPVQFLVSFLVGVGWSQGMQWARGWLTRKVERRSAALLHLLSDPERPRVRTNSVPALAFPRPAVLWWRFLHGAGLTHLADEQLVACAIYRAEVARETIPPAWTIFRLWRRARGQPVVLLSAVGIGLLTAALVLFPRLTPLVQAGFILLLSLWIPDPLTDERKPTGSEASRLLCYNWCALWGSWVVLYLVFFARTHSSGQLPLGLAALEVGGRIPVWIVAIDFLNNVNTLILVVCYLLLNAIVVPPDPPSDAAASGFEVKPLPLYLGGFALVGVLTAAEILYHWYRWPLPAERYDPHLFTWVSGFTGGVVLAMLVGRLQSKFITPPVWLVTLLYVYAVIQGAMGAFGTHPLLEDMLPVIAFALKCLLFLFFAWILESGLLLFYMEEVRTGVKERERKLKDFYGEGGST